MVGIVHAYGDIAHVAPIKSIIYASDIKHHIIRWMETIFFFSSCSITRLLSNNLQYVVSAYTC